jgi:HK97 family phage portal protein
VNLGELGGWQSLAGDELFEERDTGLTVRGAYGLVPYLYRGVDMRAKAISGLPWRLERLRDGADVHDELAYRGLVRGVRMRLYLTEAALCLHGAAYWLKESNHIGGNITPRWVVPTSVRPRYEARRGLVGFERWCGETYRCGVDEVVHFWLPNLHAEVGPGVAPARVALNAAGVLHHLDVFTENFFRRGAIKMTLLTVEGNPSRAELDRLESWWRRLVAGARRAWQSIAIRSSVKPVVIGDGLKDTVNETLTTQRREEVCAALGVPHSLLSSDAASYATAQQDTLNFYQQTIVPQALLIAEVLNDQLFRALGLRWHFQPEKLEVFQAAEVQKATAIQRLVGKPVMTINEGRALMGLPPLVGADRLDDVPEQPQLVRASR